MVNKLKQEDFIGLCGDVDFKLRYLDTLLNTDYAKNTLKVNYSLFKNIGFMESLYNKDFYDFTIDETKKALKNLRRKNLIHIASDGALLRKYALYAIHQKQTMATTHPIADLGRSDFKGLMMKLDTSEQFVTKNEYKDAISKLKNWSDKALLVLIWHGVINKGHDALRNIHKDNFGDDFSTLTWCRDGEKNIYEVVYLEEWESYVIKNSFLETQYKMEKSKIKFGTKSQDDGRTFTINEGCYLFRNFVNKRNNEDNPVQSQIITNRFKHIKSALDKSQWRINNIFMSGLVYKLLQERTDWSKYDVRIFISENPQLGISFENFYSVFEKLSVKYSQK